jgi:hypothetical protein
MAMMVQIGVADPTSKLEVLLDTLTTATAIRTDDLLEDLPERAPWRP